MAGAILALGIAGLALMIPGYNHVQPDGQRDWRDWLAGQISIRRLVVLRGSLHPGFRRGCSLSVGRGRPLPIGCIPDRVHGVVSCGSRSLRLPASTSQHFRHFRVDRLPGTTVLGADMETRLAGKTPCFLLLDFLSAYMYRNRSELEFALQTRTGLGAREACLWPGTKSPLRCLVRLVRRCWFVTVSREMTKAGGRLRGCSGENPIEIERAVAANPDGDQHWRGLRVVELVIV